ncbi:MAG TPA: dihydropteroate synthase [Dehalococcoidia bacterium]|nr:dihydropteroate synthase [Dehalococcoidia bacterium]
MTANARPGMTLRSRRFDWGARTYVMGIINVSPESFSGDGLAGAAEAAEQARRFEAEGADIIDVGGQSTRPVVRASDASQAGYEQLSAEAEIERVVPAIEAVIAATSLPVSIDAYRMPVVEAAIEAGAHLINDIWGFRHDPALAALAATRGLPAVVMHNQRGRDFHDVIGDITAGFTESTRIAREAGLAPDQLILDPGFGFGWTVDQNLEMLRRLRELSALGLPLLVGTSRKSTIGVVLELPEDQRIWGTAATVALSIANGADIVRVHDVAAMKQVCVMTDAVVRRRPER